MGHPLDSFVRFADLDCDGRTARFHSVEHLPQRLRCFFGGVERLLGLLWMHCDFGAQQFAPDVRVFNVGELMQREVAAGLGVGAVALRQALGFSFATRGTCDS